jgi:CheY-like chemotaxis protein
MYLSAMADPKTILCVDDDEDDRFFLSNAIHHINPALKVVEVENGVEALSYLHEAKQKDDLPCLIVLDINMPYLDGKQTLEKIRTDMDLKTLPVVVFTSSENPNDRALFKSRGVEMVTKPMDNVHLRHVVKDFLFYCS